MSRNWTMPCPSCQTLNRVSVERAGQSPVCGRCRAQLFEAAPMELDDATFGQHVRPGGPPLLVDFWAPWCGPCKTMAPQFAEAAGLLHPRVRLAKLNTQDNQAVAGRLGIQSIPTMVLFLDGREAARISGAMSARDIAGWTTRQLKD